MKVEISANVSNRSRHQAALLVGLLLVACSSALLHAEPPPATLERKFLDHVERSHRADLAIDPTDTDTMYWVGNRRGVLKSVDGGQSWTPMNSGLPTLTTESIAMDPNDPNHLLVSLDDGSRPYRSTDGAVRWEPTLICEHQQGPVNLTNVRESGFVYNLFFDISFDPTDSDTVYLPLKNQFEVCGGFYRSCDAGATYDHNPRCYESPAFEGGITPDTPRPVCAENDPLPRWETYPLGNDVDLLGFDTDAGAIFIGTEVHNEYAMMTSYDKGISFGWEDVLDMRNSFVQQSPQTVASLFPDALAVAPSEQSIRYAGFVASGSHENELKRICPDGKAYVALWPCPNAWPECPAEDLPVCSTPVHQQLQAGRVYARWSGEMSGEEGEDVDCTDNNDCDNDDSPDRVWRPIYETSEEVHSGWGSAIVDPQDPNRVFVMRGNANGLYDSSGELLMLTPSDPSDPGVTPWQATPIYTGDQVPGKLIQDPGNPNSFYMLTWVYDTQTPGNWLYRLTKPAGGWETWDANGACEAGDPNCELLLELGPQTLQIYDLMEYEDGALVGMTYGTCFGQAVGTCNWPPGNTTSCETDDDCTQGQCELIECHSHSGSTVALTAASTGRIYIREGATRVNDDHFNGPYGVLFHRMDAPQFSRHVMCTSVLHDLVVDPDDETLLYGATGAGIWAHPNGHIPIDQEDMEATSKEWVKLAGTDEGLTDDYIWSLVFDPQDRTHDTMLAGSRDGAIYESTDRGQSWAEQPISVPHAFEEALADVKDFAFLDDYAFAATAAGVLRRAEKSSIWTASLEGETIEHVTAGASGDRRLYAIGTGGVFRSFDWGATWEAIDLDITPPRGHGAVLETMAEDGRHHLWVADDTLGLHVASTELSATAGYYSSQCQVVIDLGTEDPDEWVGAELHYGADPDLLGGSGANEGASPITLGVGTTVTLTGLPCDSEPQYVVLESASGVRGLPLRVDFERLFAPQIETVSVTGECPLEVQLTWAPVPGAIGYQVLRSGGGQCCGYQIVSGDLDIDLTTVTFTDTSEGLLFDRAYYYTAKALYGTFILELSAAGPAVPLTTPDAYDPDEDAWAHYCDNCGWVYNPDQQDYIPFPNGNGIGDVCECSQDSDCDDFNRCTDDRCLFEFGSPYGECRYQGDCP